MNKIVRDYYESYLEWFALKRPTNLLKSACKLGEECGEVFESIAAFTGSKTKIKKLLEKGQTPRESILEECGDVLMVVLNIATLCGISHEELLIAAKKKADRRSEKMLKGLEYVKSRTTKRRVTTTKITTN